MPKQRKIRRPDDLDAQGQMALEQMEKDGLRSSADVYFGVEAGQAKGMFQDIREDLGRSGNNDWVERAMGDAWQEAERIIANLEESYRLSEKYKDDPVGFCRDVLHERTTPDTEKVMWSVLENPVTIARSSTGPGKSFCAASLAVWFYKVFIESKVYLTAAQPFENLKRILWGEVWAKVKRNRELFRYDVIRSLYVGRSEEEASDEGTNSFIVGWSIPQGGTAQDREAKFSGKHAPQLFFVVDEGDAVPDEVYKGIEGCSSGGMYRVLIMFNPKIRSGIVYHKETNRLANVVHLSSFRHPNVVEGKTLIPGAVDRPTTVRRINEWTRPMAVDEKEDEACYEVPEFLIGETAKAADGRLYPPLAGGMRKIVDPAFSYMVLGDYPTQGEQQLIAEDWISSARARHDLYVAQYGDRPPSGVLPIMGLDVAEYGVDANVACFRYGGYVSFESWNGVDVDETGLRALHLALQKNVSMAFIDATGVGSSVAPSMMRRGRERHAEVRAVSVKTASSPSRAQKAEQGEFNQLGDQLWWMLREWLRADSGAMLPPDTLLLDELRAPTYEKLKNGKIQVTHKDQLRKLLHRSPDRADALRLTFTPIHKAKVVQLMMS